MTDAEKIIRRALAEIRWSEPLFASAVAIFQPSEVPFTIPVSTDGENLLYNAKWVQQIYEKRGMAALRAHILHLVMHCILDHLAEEDSYGCQEGKWLFMDREVRFYMREFGFLEEQRLTKEQDEVLRICNEIAGKTVSHRSYYKVHRNKRFQKRAENYYRIMKTDEHAFWKSRWAEAEGKGEMANLVHHKEVIEKWKMVREMMDAGKLQSGKIFGIKRGDALFTAQKKGQDPIDFRVWLSRFFEREVTEKEEDEMFDHAWYQYGLSLYGDVPLLEPKEEEREELYKGTVFVALDTSGSCAGRLMSVFLTELEALWAEYMAMSEDGELYLLQCDCEIQKEQHFRRGDSLAVDQLALRGNGGTSFEPVFRRIEEIRKQKQVTPKLLVYLTDGYGTCPEEKPDYPVLFVMPDRPPDRCNPLLYYGACENKIPEWIEKAVIGNPAGKEEQDGNDGNDANHAGIV